MIYSVTFAHAINEGIEHMTLIVSAESKEEAIEQCKEHVRRHTNKPYFELKKVKRI